jgi:hypothetical protein
MNNPMEHSPDAQLRHTKSYVAIYVARNANLALGHVTKNKG